MEKWPRAAGGHSYASLTRHSHQLNPLFTPPMRRLHRRLGAATLATADAARVGPRSLETVGSGSTLLGHYDSGIYRDSRVSALPQLGAARLRAGEHTSLEPSGARRGAAARRPCDWPPQGWRPAAAAAVQSPSDRRPLQDAAGFARIDPIRPLLGILNI